MTTVVDASVAVKFTVDEEGTTDALRLLEGEPDLIAPDLILVETANAFWSMVRGSRLLETHAVDNLEAMPDFFRRLYPTSDLMADALFLGFRLRHPVYDCVYLALARKLDLPLVTADRRFLDKIGRWGRATLLADWQPA